MLSLSLPQLLLIILGSLKEEFCFNHYISYTKIRWDGLKKHQYSIPSKEGEDAEGDVIGHTPGLPWSELSISCSTSNPCCSNFHCYKQLFHKKTKRSHISQSIATISYFDPIRAEKIQETSMYNQSKQLLQLLWNSLPSPFLYFLLILLENNTEELFHTCKKSLSLDFMKTETRLCSCAKAKRIALLLHFSSGK